MVMQEPKKPLSDEGAQPLRSVGRTTGSMGVKPNKQGLRAGRIDRFVKDDLILHSCFPNLLETEGAPFSRLRSRPLSHTRIYMPTAQSDTVNAAKFECWVRKVLANQETPQVWAIG